MTEQQPLRKPTHKPNIQDSTSPDVVDVEVKSTNVSDLMRQIMTTPPDNPGGDAPPLTPNDIQQLQRLVGNKRTAELVQRWHNPESRNDVDVAAPPPYPRVPRVPSRKPPTAVPSVQRAPADEPAEDEQYDEQEEALELQPQPDFDEPVIQPCPCDDEDSVQRMPDEAAATPEKPIQRGLWGSVKKGVKKAGKAVKKAAKKVTKAGKKFGKWASKPFKWVINKAKKLARKLLKPVMRAAQSAFGSVCKLIGKITPDFNFNLGKLIPLNFDWIAAGIKNIFKGLAAFGRLAAALMGRIMDFIKPIISKILNMISMRIRFAFKNFFKGFKMVWGKIPGVSAPDIDFKAVDSASRKAMGYAMTGAHQVNELRSQSKRASSKGGKVGKAVGSVMAPVRKSVMKMFEGCLKRVPLLDSLAQSARTLLERFKKLFLVVGDSLVTGAVDEMVQSSPCSDGESSVTLQAGASVPLGGAVSVEAGKSLEITKRSGTEVAFTHTTRGGISAGYESGGDDEEAEPEPESGEEEEKQREEALEKQAAASIGMAMEDGETYVYDSSKDGDMLSAGIHTLYRQGWSSQDPYLSTLVDFYGGMAEGATGFDIPMPDEYLESRSTALELNIALSASVEGSDGSVGMDYSNNGKAILEEFTSGERRIATEMSGGLTISASAFGESGSMGSDTPGEEELSEALGEEVSLDSSTMILEVMVGKDGKVKEVAYVISAETPSTASTEALYAALLGEEAGGLAAAASEEMDAGISYHEAGTYEMRFVVRDGLDKLNTSKLKRGDVTDFEKVIHQIQEYGELEYITKGSTRSLEVGFDEGNAELTFGVSQDTQQQNYQYDENGKLRDECK